MTTPPLPSNKILFYEGPHYMYSNFASFAVEWRGRVWPTVEHAYQATKFDDPAIIHEIWSARSAHDAKKIARSYDNRRADWNDEKLGFMEEILRAKLQQHPYIQRKLAETGDSLIVEDSPKDSFWGRGPDWQGANHLGKLWMKLRGELKQS